MDDRSEHRLAHAVRDLLACLARAALMASPARAEEERRTALRLHDTVRALANPAALAALEIDGLWSAALQQAETPDLDDQPLRVSQQMPVACPIALGDLVEPGLALPDLERRIRDAASTG